ncbi:hypothetical protein BO70DRAFT_382626 [Aspergillus heteromorphus CBS 117.55]|uniref:Zn(2)-C6 fungal-type domain-containing protein n=1 Tax=Aspergillus heteromorphus CBS 117.55 TaxID=1448321 RepID=A0A317V480_9EURO|nr:uncharacterized protein BO70DRAFT_382626 [Aspergillus heteromorphus CBS 117.55]PWY69084.1 hypothetical protein BO70DRAFT_382626 [Aspergillus heteromorphus CBS 117.55]
MQGGPAASPTPEGDRYTYTPLRRTARACDSCHRRKIQCDTSIPCNWCRHHNLDCTFDRPIGGSKRRKASHPRPPPPPNPNPNPNPNSNPNPNPNPNPSPNPNPNPTPSTSQRSSRSNEELEDRVERLEQLLMQSISTNDHPKHCFSLLSKGCLDTGHGPGTASPLSSETSTPNWVPHPSSGLCFGKLHFAGRYVGDFSSYSGIPCFSHDGHEWVRSRTGEDDTFEGIFTFKFPKEAPLFMSPDANMQVFPGGPELPDRSVVDQYTTHYFSTGVRIVFPIIDKLLFQDTINMAYQPPRGSPSVEQTSARMCVLAFLAFVDEIEPSADLPPINSDLCAAKAQSLLPFILHDISLQTLQGMILQSAYRTFTGELLVANQFHSMACRIMFTLGGQTLAPERPAAGRLTETEERTWQFQKTLRRLFWLCYGYDKEICFRTGQPPVIDDDHCDLNLPEHYSNMQYPEPDQDPDLYDEVTIPLFPGDLRLTMLKSKTYRTLYSSSALRKSDAQLLQTIRELDDELEQWRLSVPVPHRPSLGPLFETHSNPLLRMQGIVVRLEYHYMMVTIHRSSGRCQAWKNTEMGEMEGVNSSMVLAVEASRSTLNYLRSVIGFIRAETFWMIIFYPMSAILTIFCNILMNPLDPRAEEDLTLLSVVPVFIKDVRLRRITNNEISHMKMVGNFVAELTRLGHCAIDKARRNLR